MMDKNASPEKVNYETVVHYVREATVVLVRVELGYDVGEHVRMDRDKVLSILATAPNAEYYDEYVVRRFPDGKLVIL